MNRLLDYERTLGLLTSKEFAEHIGVTSDAISPQMLSNWKAGDDLALKSLLLMKPTVRARLLLERPAEEELVQLGFQLGLAAARKAIERVEAEHHCV